MKTAGELDENAAAWADYDKCAEKEIISFKTAQDTQDRHVRTGIDTTRHDTTVRGQGT